MREGSEGDGGGGIDDIPTSRDADSTVSNGPGRMGIHTTSGPLAVHDGLPLANTALANALLGIQRDCSHTNGHNGNGEALLGVHSTNARIVKGNGDSNGQSRDKSFMCNICNRSFGYKHVLQNHERTHTGEKPFECKECHKRFTRDHHLKTHMRLHTGEKPYHCSHCERQFVQVANLRRHLRVHTGERPYACDLCSSRFSDSNQLKAHILIHKGEKPYGCEKCNGRFRRRHHLVHHKCPNDEANIGKPRRGRRPKAYDELPTMIAPLKQDRLPTSIVNMQPPPSTPIPVSLTSVIKREPIIIREPSSNGNRHPTGTVIRREPLIEDSPLLPQPAHMHRNHHPISPHLLSIINTNGGSHYHDTVQTGPLDMTVSSASASVSVIVPRIPQPSYLHPNSISIEGVLDLSNSRSDSEAEPIEEEVDEEDDCIDEGLDSESEEDEGQRPVVMRDPCKRETSYIVRNYYSHVQDMRRGNGERYSEDNNRDEYYISENREDPYSEEKRAVERYSEEDRMDRYCEETREDPYTANSEEDRMDRYCEETREDPYRANSDLAFDLTTDS